MLSFIKKFFGSKPTVNPCADAPYKVEKPAAPVKKPAAKKPSVKKAPAKPRKPKGNI